VGEIRGKESPRLNERDPRSEVLTVEESEKINGESEKRVDGGESEK